MTTDAQAAAFEDDLDRLLDRYVNEFDLPVYAIVGMLTVKAQAILMDALLEREDDE